MLTIILLVLILATALPHLEIPNGKWFWRRIISIFLVCTLILTYESICNGEYYLFNGQMLINFKLTCLHILVIFTGLCLIVAYFEKGSETDWTLSSDIFMISAIAGSLILSSAYTSLTLLLGLELQSFSVYVLAASHKNYEPAESAGLKYFLLGAQSSALLFMGLALLYCANGSLNLDIVQHLAHSDCSSGGSDTVLNVNGIQSSFVAFLPSTTKAQLQYFGIILIFIGLIWKIAAFPLHAWSVDVYDAVPNNTAAFLSLIPKIALISTLLRMTVNLCANLEVVTGSSLGNSITSVSGYFLIMYTTIIILSLSGGAIIGLYQPRIKRLLAYSSILNMGFILMSILLTNSLSLSNNYSVLTYVIQYIIVTAATWLCIIAIPALSLNDKNIELTVQSQLQGISNQNKENGNLNYILAITLTVLILSTAGIPPMIGFFAKYDVILLAVQTEHMILAIFAIFASLISTVYYLRLVRNIWFVSNISNSSHGSEPRTKVDQHQNKYTQVSGLSNLLLDRNSNRNMPMYSATKGWLISNNYTNITSMITLIVIAYVLVYSPLNTFISVFS